MIFSIITTLLSSGLWTSGEPDVFTRLLKEAFGSFCEFAPRFGDFVVLPFDKLTLR
jgi:hypothetical protein